MKSQPNPFEQSHIRDAIARNEPERLRPFIEEYGVETVRAITSTLLMADRAEKIFKEFEEASPCRKE